MTRVFQNDLNDILADPNIQWKSLQNSTVLITGATGLIGSILVHALSAADIKYKLNLRILAHGRDPKRGNSLANECNAKFISSDIRSSSIRTQIDGRIDYLFHCAAITKSSDMVSKPIDVISTAVDGTKNMLELAQERKCQSFVYLSTMEVYGQTNLIEVCECDLGWLDLTSPRSSYPESKRFCEMLCTSYHAQEDVSVKIARLACTFGAGIPHEGDTRVANQFARKAFAGENIELHTLGNSVLNCCYTSDAVRGLLLILLKGRSSEIYNISNPDSSMTVRDMAELVANKVCDGRIKVICNLPDDIAERGYAPDVSFTLNVDKLKLLGWNPKFELVEMYQRMIDHWKGLQPL